MSTYLPTHFLTPAVRGAQEAIDAAFKDAAERSIARSALDLAVAGMAEWRQMIEKLTAEGRELFNRICKSFWILAAV